MDLDPVSADPAPHASTDSTDRPDRSDRPKAPRWRHVVCFAIVLALIVFDLWSKTYVFAFLADESTPLDTSDASLPPRYPVLGNWLAWMKNLNYGAAFGQLTGIPYLLVGLRVAAVLLLTWLIVRAPRGQVVYLTSLVLISAGAAGNLYDNFFYVPDHAAAGERPFGPVRDFIDVYFGVWDWHFPTFNVADSCITVGAVLLILSGFGSSPERAESDPESDSSAPPGEGAAQP